MGARLNATNILQYTMNVQNRQAVDILGKSFAQSNFFPLKVVPPPVKVLQVPLIDPLKGNITHHYVVQMNRILSLKMPAPFSFMFFGTS